MFPPVLITPPAETPVSLAEIIAHCRAPADGSDDAVLTAFIREVTWFVEHLLKRALVTQTWRLMFPYFPPREREVMALGPEPVQSIVSVTYFDMENNELTLDPSVYALLTDVRGPYLTLQVDQAWPETYARADAISVTFIAGYGGPDDVPLDLKAAIKLMVGHWYNNREAVAVDVSPKELPLAVDSLLSPYRKMVA